LGFDYGISFTAGWPVITRPLTWQ